MKYYVSKEDIENAITYFKTNNFENNDKYPYYISMFLLSKHFGITSSRAITYKVGYLSDDQKKEYLNTMWLFGGLFDETEKGISRCLLFPTSIYKLCFYQEGTKFGSVLTRAKDTVEKKNVNVPIYSNNDSMLTLTPNYRDIIEENYLKGNKISLSCLAAWLFRFTAFEFETEPTSKQFTRVLEKAVRKFFKITKKDFLWLFDNDLSTKRISPARKGVTGEELRSYFDYEDGEKPEIEKAQQDDIVYSNTLPKDIVDQYLALNGDNPSDNDIIAILKAKKQIVLTGVPGVGKSRYTTMLSKKDTFDESRTEIVQFHPSYSYEDFIGAEILKTDMVTNPMSNGTYVSTRKGAFLSFVDKAKNDPDHDYLFIIDELNRGNIAEIFGETILALDRNYKVTLTKEYEGTKELQIPENLYIVGTMNTSDRNIAFLDLAIRRRFAFVPLYPNYDFLSEDVVLEDIDLGNVLKVINQRIVGVLKDPELILGQSYFIPPEKDGKYVWEYDDFKNQFNFVILPTLREYSFNEASAVNTIVGENLADGIQDVDDFKIAFESEFSA